MRDINETIIRISNIGEVEVTTIADNNTRIIKKVSLDDMVNAIRASVEPVQEVETVASPILPYSDMFGVRTVAYKNYSDGREQVVLFKKAHRCKMVYHTQVFENVGIPNLLFAITFKDNKVRKANVVAVKDDIIKDNTKLFCYPFSNASERDGSICFGANSIYDYEYEHLQNTIGFPSMFLDMPNNDHMYGSNLSGLAYRPFLEKLSNNDFDNEYLKPCDYNFETWFKKIVK